MRILAIITVSAIALAPGAAFAQLSSPGGIGHSPAPPAHAIGGPASAPGAQAKAPAVNPLSAQDVSRLAGTDVYGSQGHRIGDVSAALMDPQSRKINRLVVSAGGVLGFGAHHVAIPIEQFKWQADKGGFQIAETGQQLKSMPEWHDDFRSSGSAAASVPPAKSGEPHM